MSWTTHSRTLAEPIYGEILKLPFIEELIDGRLPQEKFAFYIVQDAHYLLYFGKALSAIAARMAKQEHILQFTRFAEETFVVERALHEGYMQAFNSSEVVDVSPSCGHYTSFLMQQAFAEPVEVAVATILPCFWIYKEVGDYIYSQAHLEGHPYSNWIATYAGEEFAQSVKVALQIADEIAAHCNEKQKAAMAASYLQACRLEWLFWDSAYQLERWPV